MSTVTYTIRRPGHTCWTDGITTIERAREERTRADRVVPGHRIVVVADDGSTRWADDDGLAPWESSDGLDHRAPHQISPTLAVAPQVMGAIVEVDDTRWYAARLQARYQDDRPGTLLRGGPPLSWCRRHEMIDSDRRWYGLLDADERERLADDIDRMTSDERVGGGR